ncbi:MAG: hypothetical protein KJ906_00275 [Nanoarchaeota archaeon]|nr:hypothetical protein [Nanoarchaeota archaeon]
METTEETLKMVSTTIFILIGFLIFIYLINKLTGGAVVRWIVCGILFWVPLASMMGALSQACAAIPGG